MRTGCFFLLFHALYCFTQHFHFNLPRGREQNNKQPIMTSDLNSSLTSIDWLPQLGISSLRSGRDRGAEKDRKRDRGRERGDGLPPVPSPAPSNSKGKPPHSYT
ncbi:hypothetical protein CRUP_006702 [Coryphaenoides rupestris]|nr:hypothetical protein CRUP_006702 [Coryphaenoides rupestris]